MEATALSLGKAALDGAVGYAKSVLAEEIALQLGVEKDVSFITDELEMMQSFLMAADREQDKNRVVLTWVKQVREVAYNVEDGLMDFSAHSEQRPCWWWCIPRTLWERRDIAKEMKELRTKVEDVSNRNLRYRLIKGSGSKQSTSVEEQAIVASEVAMIGINEARRAAAEQEDSKVDLCQLITNEDTDLRVMAMWGTSGDLGKTSLIREAYEHHVVYQKFGCCRAWVMLTSPFSPSEFFNSLLRQFYVHSREVGGKESGYDVLKEMEKMEQNHVADQVLAYLKEKRYLIVIDGLTTIVEWDWIKTYFPDKKNGSLIIVSAQRVEVASLCPQQPYQVTKLKQLSSDQSIYLLHNKVSGTSQVGTRSMNNAAMPSSSSGIQEETQQQMDVGEGRPEKMLGRSKTMVAIAEDLVGRMNEKDDVINLIGQADQSHNHKVISVWGMGGLGKTTLVRSVYQSPRLGGWKRAWVTALRPFNSEVILRNIVLQLQKDIQEDPAAASGKNQEKKAITEMGLEELIAKLVPLVSQECLIVVDDLSNTQEWNSVNQSLAKAGCVIVTTREKIVAMHCSTEAKNIYSLQRLEDTAALDLFKKKVFKDNAEKVDLHLDMVEQARLILKKCDGLPLAISTIGGFLATKPKTAMEWRRTHDRISIELETNPELRTIKGVLVRSYDGLPYHLKSCFLYLSIFPEDHKIRRKQVIRRWVAEGYAREMLGMTAEEVGDKYFEELLDRSMILPGDDVNIYSGKVDSCQLHDIMRQICISKARDENLAFTLEDGISLSSAQGATRHLAISSNWERDKDVFQRILDLSHLRSMTVVFGEWKSFLISRKMRFLRVLDLHGTKGIEYHHLCQIGELIHLKYLSLQGCNGLYSLPNSVGSLRNLQTLDIRDTRIWKLPHIITNLRKLQFLRATSVGLPRGIGKLNALCTLAQVLVDMKMKGIIKELAQLYHLRKLVVDWVTETNSKEFWSAIHSLNHLRSLSVNWYLSLSLDVLDSSLGGSLLPPRSIESLKLGTRVARLTEWIYQLQNLSRLQLRHAQLQQQDALQAVGKLKNLAILDMRVYSFQGEELLFEQGSFPSLVLLVLDYILDVPCVKFEDGTIPNLELLRIVGWRELQELTGLRYLTKLREIQLDLRYNMELKHIVQEQLVEHPNSNVKVLWK